MEDVLDDPLEVLPSELKEDERIFPLLLPAFFFLLVPVLLLFDELFPTALLDLLLGFLLGLDFLLADFSFSLALVKDLTGVFVLLDSVD